MKITASAIVGAGAVGSVVLKKLYDKYQGAVSIVASGERKERLSTKGINVNGEVFCPNVISGEGAHEPIDLLIICVKNYHLEQTMEDIEKIINKNTIILPLLNGITATDRLQKRFPENRVLYGIMMRTDAERLKYKVTYSTAGEIQFGYAKNETLTEELSAVKEYLEQAEVNAKIYPDMRKMLWRKWMINIGANPVSLITCAQFKYFGLEEIIYLMRDSLTEILKIAEAEGVSMTEQDMEDIIQILINYPPEKKTSMLQDLEACRRTEIDEFSGQVVRLGEKHGIPTPVNRTLYYAIKAREHIYLKSK